VQPLIGITGMRHVIQVKSAGPVLLGVASADDYALGIESAGGVPLVIPYIEQKSSVAALAKKLDGLLLSGGEDMDPILFDENPRSGLGQVVPERDELELALIHEMLGQRKPILGICRGMQVLNVALGGTLYQDLDRQWRGLIAHQQKARRDHLSHGIRIESKSQLYDLLGRQKYLRTNSFHHQAVRKLAKSLRPVAWDEEGLIEGVEHVSASFILAVQWHPENLWRTHSVFHGLFKGLVEASSTPAT
jgi:putative glutamine amidotransferase